MQSAAKIPDRERARPHGFVRTVYLARSFAFAYAFLALGLHCLDRGAATTTWVFLGLTFLVYPHLAYRVSLASSEPRHAEYRNLLFDAFLFGAWSAQLSFPLWLTFALLSGAVLNNLVNRGTRGLPASFALFALGAGLWGAARGFAVELDTSPVVTGFAFVGALGYACLVGAIVHRQTRRLILTRKELRMSEERYRLITEHAGDLIAMVDAEGRWRYTSPSYRRLLPESDVLNGTDAFARIHPDDAEKARGALRRMVETGADEQFDLRVVCTDGGVRLIESTGHPVRDAQGEWSRVVLVSRDVSELQAGREQLKVAALAFENMSEAIMISSADGRVVSVNKAFSRITGFKSEDVVGQPESRLRLAMQPAAYYDTVYATVVRDGRWAGGSWSRRSDGSLYREWRTVSAVHDEQGRIAYYVSVFFETDADMRMTGAGL